MSGEAPHCLVAPETIAAMLKRAEATPFGTFIEVGVYHGGTAWHLAKLAESQGRPLYLFDTFAGMPYAIEGLDSHPVGDFKDTSLEAVQAAIPYAICVKGIFPQGDELPPSPTIAFAHLDCDQYQSYRDALDYLDTRMIPGGLIWCDDVPCLAGAAKALNEYCARTGRTWELAEKAFIRY